MYEHLKLSFFVVVFYLNRVFSSEEGYSLPVTASNTVSDLQLVGTELEEWTIENCFREKSFELVFLIDSNYDYDGSRNLQKEKEFLIKIVEKLNLGPNTNKFSIIT